MCLGEIPKKYPEITSRKTARNFSEHFSEHFSENQEGVSMRSKRIKDRCTKMQLSKCDTTARLYDQVMIAFAGLLERNKQVSKIMCNVSMDGLDEGEFTSDFVCVKANGDYMVRECTWRKKLTLPRTARLLEASRKYWARRGVQDWGIIVEKERNNDESN